MNDELSNSLLNNKTVPEDLANQNIQNNNILFIFVCICIVAATAILLVQTHQSKVKNFFTQIKATICCTTTTHTAIIV